MSTTELLEKLCKPFPQEAIKSRRGGGNMWFSYVDGYTVIRRLNEATGGAWDFEIMRIWKEGEIMLAHVKLHIPGLGQREHIGVATVTNRPGNEDLLKGAVTDALKKAATLFGVGLDLYGPDYEAEVEARENFAGAGNRSAALHDAGNNTPVTNARARARGENVPPPDEGAVRVARSRKAAPTQVPVQQAKAEEGEVFHEDTVEENDAARVSREHGILSQFFRKKIEELSGGRHTLSDDQEINLVNRCAGKIRIGRGNEAPTKEDYQAAINGFKELVASQKRQEERMAQKNGQR